MTFTTEVSIFALNLKHRRRAGADADARREPGEIRRLTGRARRARHGRRRQGAGRRARLRREPVQPRDRRQAPAGLVVQAVRLSDRARKGPDADTVRDDAPISVKGWSPENYSRQYFGPVTLTKALSLSLNTVAVRLGLEVGPKAVVRTAHRLGIASDLDAQRLDRARHVRSLAARTGQRLCGLRQRRHRRPAACDPARAHGRRQAALPAPQRQQRPRRSTRNMWR